MIGRAIAALDPFPRGWLRRTWGLADIHTRQKWSVLWPHLAALPERGIRLLDAGCGVGTWSFELAALRPNWTIVGVDKDGAAIQTAERTRERLAIPNVSFAEADFLGPESPGRFHVVLSVASAHYLAEQGRGPELFGRFREWLEPDGWLFLIAPRRARDVGFAPWLARPAGHPVFTGEELTLLCHQSSLRVDSLTGCVGPLATLAKQLYWEAQRRSVWLNRLLYPVQWTLSALDSHLGGRASTRTMMLLLVARAASESSSDPANALLLTS